MLGDMGRLSKGVKKWEARELRYLEEVEVKFGDALQEREGGRGQVGLQALQRRRRRGRRRLGAAALQEEAVQHRRRAHQLRGAQRRPQAGRVLAAHASASKTDNHTYNYVQKKGLQLGLIVRKLSCSQFHQNHFCLPLSLIHI